MPFIFQHNHLSKKVLVLSRLSWFPLQHSDGDLMDLFLSGLCSRNDIFPFMHQISLVFILQIDILLTPCAQENNMKYDLFS
jgi:hypothetical protein